VTAGPGRRLLQARPSRATQETNTAVTLVVRLGQFGWVVGEVATAAGPVLARFVRQKTVLVTTFRQDGRVGTPVSLAVDGDHVYLRSFEQAGKTRRLHHNPKVDIAPSTARGRPTGPGHPGHGQAPGGAEARRAARLLAGKHPLLHGLLGAVDPSPGPRQDRQDGPFPADTPRPWPGEVTAHGHPDEP
jgi:PPOX class probable F420-dependent enzyme